jgi:aryl-phospho-beta-D-glucosidase BglC (GH1 family)
MNIRQSMQDHWPWLRALCVFLAFGSAVFLRFASVHAYRRATPGIAVQDNYFVTTSAGTLGVRPVAAGEQVVLRGGHITGTEYECLVGDYVYDTIPLNQALIDAILAWHANVVRIPLSEDCWLGVPASNPPPAATSGTNYSGPISTFVNLATRSGLIVELNLHSGNGPYLVKSGNNSSQLPAMDTNYFGAFWQSVAATFENNPSVIFNLTNEPEFDSDSDWPCYRNGGCSTEGLSNSYSSSEKKYYYRVLGTQMVVNTIRATCARNPIIIAGINYSNQLDDWLEYVPSDSIATQNDPHGQMIAGIHIDFDGLNCEDPACWTSVFGRIQAAGSPIVIDETGEGDPVRNTPTKGDMGCGSGREKTLTAWADAQSQPVGNWFWAFTMVDWPDCPNGPDLLEGPNAPPPFTAWPNYGTFAQSHLQSVQ